MSEISYQQKAVLQQQEFALKSVWDANDKLDSKGNVLLVAGSLVTGLVSGAKFLPSGIAELPSPQLETAVPSILLILVLGSFVAMLTFAIKLWSPKEIVYPGPTNIDTMYKKYISRELDEAYHQALNSMLNAVDKAKIVNDSKSKSLIWMARFLQLQTFLLMLALAWPVVLKLL